MAGLKSCRISRHNFQKKHHKFCYSYVALKKVALSGEKSRVLFCKGKGWSLLGICRGC